MKRILSFLVIAALATGAFALQPVRGYRGFIDCDNTVHHESLDWGLYKTHNYRIYTGVSTSHGYQFNPTFYLGAGFSAAYNSTLDRWILPVFVEARTDQRFGWFTPYMTVRCGWSLTDGGGLYLQPMIGYRFNWGRKLGVNVGVGITAKESRLEYFDLVTTPDGYVTTVSLGKHSSSELRFAFRVGIDF